MQAPDDNFMSRWSRRKSLTRQGQTPLDDAPAPPARSPTASPPAAHGAQRSLTDGPAVAPAGAAPAQPVQADAAPPPTLHDVSLLTRESDFSRFVKPGVSADVRNAALKKLFTDPHFNIMDGLDTYIDDYNKPDPLPPGMLRKMAQASALGLCNDDPDRQAAVPAVGEHTEPTEPTVSKSSDEDADLRLQPNDAAGCSGAEPGPGEDAGRVG